MPEGVKSLKSLKSPCGFPPLEPPSYIIRTSRLDGETSRLDGLMVRGYRLSIGLMVRGYRLVIVIIIVVR